MEIGFSRKSYTPELRKDFNSLETEALVEKCLKHERPAWNEFFTRYTPHLKDSIRKALIRHGTLELSEDIDIVADIYLKLVEKIYSKQILKQCPRLDGLKNWLASVASNQTIDWLKEKGRLKNRPQLQGEAATCSLDQPLSDEEESTLLDMLAAPEEYCSVVQLRTEEVLSDLASLDNIKQRWVLRLTILGQSELSAAELEELADLSNQPLEILKQIIEALETDLAAREQERSENYGRTVLYWHELRRLERQYNRLSLDTFSQHSDECTLLQQQIREKQAKRDDLLKKCKKMPRPSDRAIAELLGIPENQIGITLRRARETLFSGFCEHSDRN